MINTANIPTSRTVFIWLSVIIVLLAGIHVVAQFISDPLPYQTFKEELINRFDMNDEQSVQTWFSVVLLFVTSCVAFFLFLYDKGRPVLWSMTALFFLFLSIDEEATFHENVLQWLSHNEFTKAFTETSAWLVLLPFLFVIFAGFIIAAFRRLPTNIASLITLGFGLYCFGFLGVEIAAENIDQNTFFYNGIIIVTEESFELLGIATICTALYAHLKNKVSKKPQ
jgi:hypothetical protein